jgi:SPP1 family predicted phage head-tail adaptor
MSMAAGKMNHRITLQSIVTTKDSNGDTLEEWVDQGSVWAEVVPLSAKEFINSSSFNSKIVARITIRKREVEANWRILFRGKYYNVEGVLPDPVSGLEYLTLPVSYGIQVQP